MTINTTLEFDGNAPNNAVLQRVINDLAAGIAAVTAAAGTPGGSNTQVQFNDGGSFGGDSGLVFNKTTNALTVGGRTIVGSVLPTFTDIPGTFNFPLILTGDGRGVSPDFVECFTAAASDGFQGVQYDWGFIAASGDKKPADNTAATAGSLEIVGAFWVQTEDTTNANTMDWGFRAVGPLNPNAVSLMGNARGDVAIGNVLSPFTGTPTTISGASIFAQGATQNVGIKNVSPTAYLHIGAGTVSAGTAPLKFSGGTNLTTAEAGAMEYNGTNLFFTRAGTTRECVITQSAVTTEALVSDTSVTVNIGGVTYKLLARA